MMIQPSRKTKGRTTKTNDQNDSNKLLIASMSFSKDMPNDRGRVAHDTSFPRCMADQYQVPLLSIVFGNAMPQEVLEMTARLERTAVQLHGDAMTK